MPKAPPLDGEGLGGGDVSAKSGATSNLTPTQPSPIEAEGNPRIALAAVAGAHGVKGEVRLKLFADSIDSLAAHSKLYVGGAETKLQSVRDGGKTAIARFDGVSSREAAEGLRGQLVEVDRDALPPLEEGEYYYADLIGLTCFDSQDNTVGSVVGVENFGAGDLLDVETVDGKRSLIPYRDGIADLVDARIIVDPAFLA